MYMWQNIHVKGVFEMQTRVLKEHHLNLPWTSVAEDDADLKKTLLLLVVVYLSLIHFSKELSQTCF